MEPNRRSRKLVRKKAAPAARSVREARPVRPARQARDTRPEREAREVEPRRLLSVWRRVLERRLKARLGAQVSVAIHDNTHTMVTFQKKRTVGSSVWRLRLHHMFLAAPDSVLVALARYVRDGDLDASAELDRYIDRNKAFIRKVSPAQLRKRLRIEPVGRHHDLGAIFEGLNRRYFDNRISATITYGPAPKRRAPRKSIKMGSYSADSKVIRIHPALDQPVVPRYFVEWIVFHEMLHHVYRVRKGEGGRRCVHPPELKAHERRFHAFERAQAWETAHLDVLLRAKLPA